MARTRPSERRPGRAPWGLIGMLGLVWLAEGIVARYEQDWRPLMAWSWATASRAARQEAVGCEVLCLGDSQVQMGVLPRVLDERLGARAYNLAIWRGQPASSYFLLRRALASGARPRAVVAGFFPGLLASPARVNASLWTELLEGPEWLDLLWTARDPRLAAYTIGRWLLPSLAARDEVRAEAAAVLGRRANPSRAKTLAYRRNWRANRGAQATDKQINFRDDGGDPDAGRRLAGWRCRPENDAYLRRFLDLAARHEIPVYWLLAPLSPATRARRDQNGLEAEYTRFVRGMQAGYPGLTIVDARSLDLDKEVFADPVHLDAQGAAALSAEVAEALRDLSANRSPDAPRWVELPTQGGRLAAARRDRDAS
jgi:hypothetical protein